MEHQLLLYKAPSCEDKTGYSRNAESGREVKVEQVMVVLPCVVIFFCTSPIFVSTMHDKTGSVFKSHYTPTGGQI